MNGRLLDQNNDIYLETGDDGKKHVARAKTKAQAVMQNILTVLRTFRGELFANPEVGAPWFQSILGKDLMFVDAVRNEIRETILSVRGVSEVMAISFDISGRKFSCNYTVRLTDGTTDKGSYSWQT